MALSSKLSTCLLVLAIFFFTFDVYAVRNVFFVNNIYFDMSKKSYTEKCNVLGNKFLNYNNKLMKKTLNTSISI